MFRKLFSKQIFIACVLSLFCMLSARAANFNVNASDDVDDLLCGVVHCSLREAINAANTLAGSDTIDFDAAVGTVQLAAVLPIITTNITINGGGGVTVSGDAANFTFCAFTVTATGNLTLNNLTVTNAKEILGGGLHNQTGGTVNLTNCSVSGNSTTVTAGGIFNDGMMMLTNGVVSVNTAANQGGGIFNFGGTGVFLQNTIVAGNNAPTAPDVSGVFAAPMFNLIGKSDCSTGITHAVNGNIVGTIAIPVDPLLAPIANNGGATQTYAIMSGGSPAANTGNNALAVDPLNALLTTDQRGASFPRIMGGRVDIGSLESTFVPTAASVSIGGQVLTSNGNAIAKARVTMTDTNGNVRTAITNPFGFYRFEDVSVGETYVFSVAHKRYAFAPQVVFVTDKISELNFVAVQSYALFKTNNVKKRFSGYAR